METTLGREDSFGKARWLVKHVLCYSEELGVKPYDSWLLMSISNTQN